MRNVMLLGILGFYFLVMGANHLAQGEVAELCPDLETLTRSIHIDLDEASWPDNLTPAMPNHHVDIVPDPDGEDMPVMRITFPPDSFYGASMHIPLVDDQGDEPDTAMLSYQIYFDEAWETTLSGKLPGFSGTYFRGGWGGRPSDGYNGWSARGMFSPTTEDGAVPIGAYLYHTETQLDRPDYVYGEGVSYHNQHNTPPLERGRWYTVQQYVRLNSVETLDGEAHGEAEEATEGRMDGVLRAWIDGEQVYNREDLRFRHTDRLRIQSAWLDFYHGGKDPAPRELIVYIRNIKVITEASAE